MAKTGRYGPHGSDTIAVQARDKTISDFGDQWTRYTENDGYYGSKTLLEDIFGPLACAEDISGKIIIDVGSGTGRIVNTLIETGARKVVAVEPSRSFDVLVANTRLHGNRVSCLNVRGDEIPSDLNAGGAVSIGVLHHIPDPLPVVCAVYRALQPGGLFVAWVYGKEGNEAYLAVFEPLRRLTTRFPHWALTVVCHMLTAALSAYAVLARFFPLPLRAYMCNVISRLDWRKRYLVVYDQLNPEFSRYYTEQEARALLEFAGFEGISTYHRHGYSWTVSGRKPVHTMQYAEGGSPQL